MKKITLKDGRVIESYDPTIREFFKASAMGNGDTDKGYSASSSLILVNGKKITAEEFKSTFRMSDILKILDIFSVVEVKYDPGHAILSNGKVAVMCDPIVGETINRLIKDKEDDIDIYASANMASSMIKVDDNPVGVSEFLDKYHYSDFLKVMAIIGEVPNA